MLLSFGIYKEEIMLSFFSLFPVSNSKYSSFVDKELAQEFHILPLFSHLSPAARLYPSMGEQSDGQNSV